jgi:hypothetical protein
MYKQTRIIKAMYKQTRQPSFNIPHHVNAHILERGGHDRADPRQGLVESTAHDRDHAHRIPHLDAAMHLEPLAELLENITSNTPWHVIDRDANTIL